LNNRRNAILLVMVVVLLASIFLVSGCNGNGPLPGNVKITICSGSTAVYGDVYVNQNKIPDVYLRPNRCLVNVYEVPVNVPCYVEVKDWLSQVTHSKTFTPTSYDSEVTIR